MDIDYLQKIHIKKEWHQFYFPSKKKFKNLLRLIGERKKCFFKKLSIYLATFRAYEHYQKSRKEAFREINNKWEENMKINKRVMSSSSFDIKVKNNFFLKD